MFLRDKDGNYRDLYHGPRQPDPVTLKELLRFILGLGGLLAYGFAYEFFPDVVPPPILFLMVVVVAVVGWRIIKGWFSGRRRGVEDYQRLVQALPETALKSYPGLPATLGSTAAAHLTLIVWCKDCRHQVEPDPAEMAERYGAEMTVPDWRERLVCSQCGSRNVDMVVSGSKHDPLSGQSQPARG